MKNPTISCHYVHAILRAAEKQGLNCELLLHQAGIPTDATKDVKARIPYENYAKLVRKVWRGLNDENYGLSAAPLPIGAFYYAGNLMMGCPTLKTALAMGMGFYQYVNDAYAMHLTEVNGEVQFEAILKQPELDPDHLFAEFILCGWHRFACWLTGQNIVLKHVGFDFAPTAHEYEYQHIFPAPRDFDQPMLSFRFSRHYLDLPVIKNAADFKDYVRRTPTDLLLNPVDDNSYGTKIRLQIESNASEGFPTFDLIADGLHMTPKTLRQKLKTEGITYQKIKDVIRRDIAIHHLTQQTCSIADIAMKAGFTETGAFIRAFKGWTGVTPGAYRNRADSDD
ncbi:MAG: AraC family transcriptional regulator [Motiliproteus sp.]